MAIDLKRLLNERKNGGSLSGLASEATRNAASKKMPITPASTPKTETNVGSKTVTKQDKFNASLRRQTNMDNSLFAPPSADDAKYNASRRHKTNQEPIKVGSEVKNAVESAFERMGTLSDVNERYNASLLPYKSKSLDSVIARENQKAEKLRAEYNEAIINYDNAKPQYAQRTPKNIIDEWKETTDNLEKLKTRRYYNELDKKRTEMENVVNNEDFEKYSSDSKGTKALTLLRHTDKTVSALDQIVAYMTESEKKIYNYYLEKDGQNKADEYFKTIERELNARRAYALSAADEKFGNSHKIIAAAEDIAASVPSMKGYFSGVKQGIKNSVTGEYEPIDINSTDFDYTRKQSDLEKGITKDMSAPSSFLTQTGLSIGKSIASSAFGPCGLLIMSSNAASQSTYEALKNGATNKQALTKGLADGFTEYITEKIPFDDYFKLIKNGNIKSAKELLKNILKQAATEGSGEIIAEYMNYATDTLVMGDKSDFNALVDLYVKNGYSYAEAEKEAYKQYLIVNPILAFTGGALSGVAMGSIGQTVGYLANRGKNAKTNGKTLQQKTQASENAQAFSPDVRNDSVQNASFEPSDKNQGTMTNDVALDNNITQSTQFVNDDGIEMEGLGANADEADIKAGARLEQILNRRYGIETVHFNDADGAKGFYDEATKKMYINDYYKANRYTTTAHEFFHAYKDIDNEGYEIIKKTVLADLSLDEYNNYKKRQLTLREKNGLSNENIDIDALVAEEAISDLGAEVLKNPESFESVLKRFGNDKTFAEKFMDFIRGLVKSVREFLNSDYIENDDDIRNLVKNYSEVEEIYQSVLASGGMMDYSTEGNGDGVRYNLTDDDDKEKIGVKQQIINNSKTLGKMQPVYDNFIAIARKGHMKDKEWVLSIFKDFKFEVTRKGLGKIVIDKKRVGNSLRYLKTDGELAAYSALPTVLEKGIIIGGHSNHKSRGYSTVTISAPVVINGVRGNMAAVVRIDENGNYYKIHRILMPDGSTFVYENKINNAGRAAAVTQGKTVDTPTDVVYKDNITQNGENVKENKKNLLPTAEEKENSIAQSNSRLAEQHFGTTTDFREAGYLTLNGELLDFSGRHWGGMESGYRTVEHGDITEVEAIPYYSDGKYYGGEAVQKFLNEGNIRLLDEKGGINLTIMPNNKQFDVLIDFINSHNGAVTVDLTDKNGIPKQVFEYGKNTSPQKIINDIKTYFSNGKTPQISELNKFHYALPTAEEKEKAKKAVEITKADIKAVQSIPRKSVNDFTSDDIKQTENLARKYFNEMGVKSPFFRSWFGDWRENDNSAVKVANQKGTVRGVTKNLDTGWDIQISGKVFNETKSHNQNYNVTARPYLDYINSIVENAVLLDSYTIPSEKAKSDNSAMMHTLYGFADLGRGNELVKLYIEELNDINSDGTIKRAYQLQNINKIPLTGTKVNLNGLTSLTQRNTYTVSQLFNLVKTYDKNFNPKPSSKLVNDDGTPKVVYHGTRDFGFTIFDTTKSDDKSTLFFTDDKDIASTYSGKEGVSKLENVNKTNYGNTPNEIVNALNDIRSADDEFMKQRYSYLDKSEFNKINTEIDQDAYALMEYLDNYDFINEKENVKNTAVKLKEKLDNLEYNTISTPLYMLLHHSSVFNDKKSAHRFSKLEKNIRLINEVEKNGKENVVVGESLDGYSFYIYDIDTAKDILSKKLKMGIYAVYLNMQNPYIVECNGSNWNDITYYEVIPEELKRFYKNGLWRHGTTREAAAYAQNEGFDGVIFKNVTDNGGNNSNVKNKTVNVYVAFNPNQIKSATDNIGTFDSGNNDIRYALPTAEEKEKAKKTYSAMEQTFKSADEAKRKSNVKTPRYDRMKNAFETFKKSGDSYDLPKKSDFNAYKRDAQRKGVYYENFEAYINKQLDSSRSEEEKTAIKKALDILLQKKIANEGEKTLIKDMDEAYKMFDTNHFYALTKEVAEDIKDNGKTVFSYKQKDFFRNMREVFGKHYGIVKEMIDDFNQSKGDMARSINERLADLYTTVVNGLEIKKGSKESAAVMWYGEGEKTPDLKNANDIKLLKKMGIKDFTNLDPNIKVKYDGARLENDFGHETAERIKKADKYFRKIYDEYIDALNAEIKRIYPYNADKLIKKRKNYYRHFSEITNSYASFLDILRKNASIDPKLAGISPYTEPKSKWASIAQERKGNATKEDAVGGFLDYIPQAEYKLNIDRHISVIRMLANDLAELKDGNGDANNFIKYLNDFANDLAGKTTSNLDRFIIDAGGRKIVKGLSWVNNRVKANKVLGNMASAAKQVLNQANGFLVLDNPKNMLKGYADWFKGKINNDEKILNRYKESNFLTERFIDDAFSKFEKRSLQSICANLLGITDEMGVRIIWNAAYDEALELNKTGKENINPAQYADDAARNACGGRGIGEVPLIYKSQAAKLILPFQLEVQNNWKVIYDYFANRGISGERIKPEKDVKKKIAKAITFLIASWGLNWITESLTGSKGGMDIIGDIADGFRQGFEEKESDKMWGKLLRGAKRVTQNVAADVADNRLFSWIYAAILEGFDEDYNDKLFNGNFYSNGVNLPALQSIMKIGKKMNEGDFVGAGAEAVTSFVTPYGGAQIDKTIRGLGDFARGGKYKNDIYKKISKSLSDDKDYEGTDGEKKYDIKRNPVTFAKSAVFGPSSLGGDYYEKQKIERYTKADKKAEKEKREKDFRKNYKNDKVIYLANVAKDNEVIPYDEVNDKFSFTREGVKYEFYIPQKLKEEYNTMLLDELEKEYDKVLNSTRFEMALNDKKLEYLKEARSAAKATVNKKIKKDYLDDSTIFEEEAEKTK